MSLMKNKQQMQISRQSRMSTNNINAEKVTDKTAQAIQLYYFSTGTLTIDAGQAAGTVVVASTGYTNILNSIGSKIATNNDTSFEFVTGTVLTTEKEIPYNVVEMYEEDTLSNLATKVTEGFANGEYCIDYENGVIYGKKATTGTSDTANYKIYDSSAIVTLEASDIQIGAVEIKDGTTDTRATVGALGSTTGLNVAIVDDTGAQITSFGSPSTIASHKSPKDFTATYTSTTTITLSALPFTITDSSQLVYIKVIPTTGDAQVLVNGSGGVTMTVSSDVLTVSGAGTPFASGDVYEIGINDQDKAYDPSTNSQMVSPLVNVWNQYTDPETLVTAQDLTASYADFGSEIDMRGYNRLGVYIVTDVNDSENVDLKVLGKHESGGTDEYEIDGITVKSLWTTGASDAKLAYTFETDGTIPYLQLQAIAGTLGATAGDLSIVITKSYV